MNNFKCLKMTKYRREVLKVNWSSLQNKQSSFICINLQEFLKLKMKNIPIKILKDNNIFLTLSFPFYKNKNVNIKMPSVNINKIKQEDMKTLEETLLMNTFSDPRQLLTLLHRNMTFHFFVYYFYLWLKVTLSSQDVLTEIL